MSDGLERLDFETELELTKKRAELHAVFDELEFGFGQVRDEMLSDPDRALAVMARARKARGIKHVPAYASYLWHQPTTPTTPTPAEPEPIRGHGYEPDEAGPPTLSALEFHWSRDSYATPIMATLEYAMAAAIGFAGGFAHLAERGDFHRTQRFDPATGELLTDSPNIVSSPHVGQ